MENDEASQRLALLLKRHVEQCSKALFSGNGLELTEKAADTVNPEPHFAYAGIVGIVGDLSGTLPIATNAKTLASTHPMRADAGLTAHMQLDWVGELANQLTGRLKIRFKRHGIAFDFSPPISLMGDRMRHIPVVGRTHRSLFVSPDGSDVDVWIDAELSEAVASRPEFFTDDVATEDPEGSVVLF